VVGPVDGRWYVKRKAIDLGSGVCKMLECVQEGAFLALLLSDGYLFVSQAIRGTKRTRCCLTKEWL
jgi:hypothetical protein